MDAYCYFCQISDRDKIIHAVYACKECNESTTFPFGEHPSSCRVCCCNYETDWQVGYICSSCDLTTPACNAENMSPNTEIQHSDDTSNVSVDDDWIQVS
jgi:hypothetical protein